MKRRIVLELDSWTDETFCRACPQMRTVRAPGNVFVETCGAFERKVLSFDGDGKPRRLPECIAAEAAANRMISVWQPIETAPSGTWVLVRHKAQSGWTSDIAISHGGGHAWWDSTGDDQIRNPTHWQPLPSTEVP